jgi:hypothetical protein
MRAIGTATQAQLDAGVISRAIRVSVFDEAGVEYPINPDLIVGTPSVKASIDDISWRMDLAIRVDATTSSLLLRGRTIQAWDVFAQGEDLSIFRGKILDPRIPQDYTEGMEKIVASLTCIGQLSDRLEARLTKHTWSPAPVNKSQATYNASRWYAPLGTDYQRLTAIVSTYRLEFPYTARTGSTTVNHPNATNPTPDTTQIHVLSLTGFTVGQKIVAYAGIKCYTGYITSVATGHIIVDTYINPSDIPNGTAIQAGGFYSIPVDRWHSPTTTLNNAVTVYNSSGTTVTAGGTNFNMYVDQAQNDGALTIVWVTTSPGAKFSIDVAAVDRYVLLENRRRLTSGALTNASWYYLSGINGLSGFERLNDQARTFVKASPTPTSSDFYVDDPTGIFATTTGSFAQTRYISVWSGGVEYRGVVASVDKTPASPTYGRVQCTGAGNALTSEAGATLTPVGAELAGNTSSSHYEILAPDQRIFIWQNATPTHIGSAFYYVPNGGWLNFAFQMGRILPVVKDANPDTLNASTGYWDLSLGGDAIAIDDASLQPNNDVGEALKGVLTASGISAGSITMAATGYTLAPFYRAQARALDLLEEVRKATVPPNFRILENESGDPVGAYIAQASTASHALRNVRSFAPRELPMRITRCIVKGAEVVTNRAGQLGYTSQNITRLQKLFDGPIADGVPLTVGAAETTGNPARMVFKMPKCEPGRFPCVTRVESIHDSVLVMSCGGSTTWGFAKLTAAASAGATTVTLNDASAFAAGSRIFLYSTTTDGAYETRTIQSKAGNVLTLSQALSYAQPIGAEVTPALTYLPPKTKPNNAEATWQTTAWEGRFEQILNPATDNYLVVENQSVLGASAANLDDIAVMVKEGAYWEAKLTDNTALAPNDGTLFGATWKQPDRTLSVSYRYAPTTWLQRNMADYTLGLDRVLEVQADGLTASQARAIAEAYLDQAVRSSEFYDVECEYDPRTQRGDTVEVPLPDGTRRNLLVWGMEKGYKTMRLTLADYSR